MPLLRPLARIWTALLGCTATLLALGLAARLLLPLLPWGEAPALVDVAPADGAADVLPRSAIRLTFSQPMNRQATLAALSISPPTPGDLSWSDDARTLTFEPRPALSAAVTYTLRLDEGALGRWWRPLAEPRSLAFRTAPIPAVVAALPSGEAPADTSVAVIFSQPMVPPERAGAPAELPQLRFEPPIAASLRWADQSTLLIRPTAPLRAAARYTVTISADLADLRGVELGRPFSWSFSTAWPELLSQSPPDGARWASPRQPLALSLATPVDVALLRQALTISPPIEGDLEASALGGTQLITFTPRLGWEPGESYAVTLSAPPGSGLSAPPDLGWRFSVAPRPGLLAFFPGQGQTLAPGEAVRLIFSTPMDEAALRAGLSIEPPVADLPISVRETEVRLRPQLQPSTLYTITLAAGTRDRNGEPIADAVSLRLRGGPAQPALRAPDAPGGIVTIPLSTTAAVELERTNIARLDLALYRLDTPTLLRALSFGPADWRAFQPERYGQTVARIWRVDLAGPTDTAARERLPIGPADGSELAAGAYYLRATSREGPRADLIVLVSSVRLAMRQGEGQTLIWATDAVSGAPLAGVPVTLYAGEAPLARGVTGPDGVWSQVAQRTPQDPPYLAVAEGDEPALVSAAWAAPAPTEPRTRALLLLDALEYRAGATARLAGQARRVGPDGGLAPPAPDTPCRLQLVSDGGPRPLAPLAAECALTNGGAVSGRVRLDPRTAPGAYTLRAQLGDVLTLLPLRVSAPDSAARLTVTPAGADRLALEASADGLPLVGAVVSWSLSLEPLAAPAIAAGYRLAEAAPPVGQSGSGSTDDEGRLSIDLPRLAPGAGPARYRLRAELRAPGDLRATTEDLGLIAASGGSVGLRLPAQVVGSAERAAVELLALDATGQPAPNAALVVEVFRGADITGSPLLVRRARSDAAGRASAQLVQLNPGRYSVVARLGDALARTDLWVAGGGYAGWENPPGRVGLIPDREVYRPGDVARLLVASPAAVASLLLTVERDGLRSYEVRELRAGQLITLTVTPDMAPAVSLGALLSTPEARLVGDTSLRVAAEIVPLSVAVAAERADYLPGATAAITVSVAEGRAPAAADLMLAIAPDNALPPGRPDGAAIFAPGTPARLAAAVEPPGGAAPAQPITLPQIAPPGYLVPVSGGAGTIGTTVAQARLPDLPGRWRVVAYAFGGGERSAAASTTVSTSLPLDLQAEAPPALRPADEAAVGIGLRNTSGVTRTLSVTLSIAGATLLPGESATQQVLLPPGGAQRVIWRIRAGDAGGGGRLSFRVRGEGVDERVARDLTLLPGAGPAPGEATTIAGAGGLQVDLGPAPAGLEIALAPSPRASLATAAEELGALGERDVEQRAALLLIGAGLAREGPADERDRWRALAEQAAAELADAQNTDGGWGWWPGSPSDPFVSAFAIEAQAAAREALGPDVALSLRGLSYLEGALADAGPDLQAYAGYALHRAGRAAAQATQPRATELGPGGLAYLALSLPPSQAAPLVARAAGQAELAQPLADADMPRTPLAQTATLVQALRELQPESPALPAAERALREGWGPGGWPSAYEAARAAAALLPAGAAPEPPRRLLLGGEALGGTPIERTLRLRLAPDDLAGPTALVVEAPPGSDYLLAYSGAAAGQPAPGAAPLIETRYLDPASGAALDPAGLRVGQAVVIELTLITPRPLLRADLLAELPAALEPLAVARPSAFARLRLDGAARSVTLSAANLPAGVYSARIQSRVTAAGSYGAPPPRLHAPFTEGGSVSGREPLRANAAR